MFFDIPVFLVGVLAFVASAGVLWFISMYGTQEKSYEEALAEQRQQTNYLLGLQNRTKSKEKKLKKTGKKVKEKQPALISTRNEEPEEEAESDKQSLTETNDSSTSVEPVKHHVEFKEEPATIELEPVKENVGKKEQEKLSKANVETSAEPKNNKKPPKQTSEAPTEVPEEPKASKKIVKQTNEAVPAPPVAEKEEAPQPNNGSVPPPTVKDKKKKKSELSTIQQLAGDKQGLNLGVLNNLVRKAELSRSEIQILIDVLLNKQHEAPAVLDEWSEGKADPVQRLKKQLAEKEKSLAEEQEALASAQAKLKEVRAEQAGERSQLQQRTRALEETLQAKQLECQSANNHLHSINQKVQQLQVQLNEEIMKNRKLMDEHTGLQMQRQQLEHHLAQTQETQGNVVQLQNDLQELQAHNNQLTKELITINEQKEHQQATIVQFQHQLGHFTKDLDQKNEIIRQMEDAHAELEHRLSVCHKQDNDLTLEIAQLKSNCQQQHEEIRRLELGTNQSLNEIRLFQEQEDSFEKIIFQLKSEVKQLQDEKLQLEATMKAGSLEENKSHKIEVMNLHNEISSVKTQLQQAEKKHAVELEATVKKYQVEIEELKTKNNATIVKVRQEEQQIYRNLIQRLFPDLKINDGVPQDQWILEAEQTIQNYVTSLQNDARLPKQTDNSEVAKLRAQILNYKSVIDDTEGMLNKLQAHIEEEETNWRKEKEAKDAEIEALKQQHVKQLQTQLAALETQLRTEQEAKQRLTEECLSYKTRSTISEVEKLSEEVNRLSEELRVERTRNVELQAQVDTSAKTQNHNSSNGPSISIEN